MVDTTDDHTHLETQHEVASDTEESSKEPPDKGEADPALESATVLPYVPKTISLCGAVTLSEVKNLLQEWINSTNGTWCNFPSYSVKNDASVFRAVLYGRMKNDAPQRPMFNKHI